MSKTFAQPRSVGTIVLALLIALCAALSAPASSLAAPGPIALKVTPSPASFPKTTVGEKSQLEIDIFNEGEEASIEKIAIEGADAGEFSTSANSCSPVVLPEGQHCSVTFQFTPGSIGPKQTTAYIRFNGGARPEESFELSGTAVEPHLSFTPSSHDFGVQAVNSEGAQTTLQLKNDGEAAVQINWLELTNGYNGWGYNDPNCANHTLAPGQSCFVQVYFGPSETGSFTNQLRARAANTTYFSADLSGEGARPEIEATPNPLDFGAATVGATGSTRTITLTNNGRVSTGFFIAIVSGGDSGSFHLLDESCTGYEFHPGATCTAHVRFTPLAAGPISATMSFFGDGDGPMQLPLTGEGVAPAVSISPSAFDFGSQAKGGKSAGHAFVVRNNGGSPVAIDSASLVGLDLDQFGLAGDTCTGVTLAAGEECQVRVRFSPDATGSQAATLRIRGDAVSLNAALSGTATAPPAATPHVSFHWRHGAHNLHRGATLSAGTARCLGAERCQVTVRTQLNVIRHPRPGLLETQVAHLPKSSITLAANTSRPLVVRLPAALRELIERGRATLVMDVRWSADGQVGQVANRTPVR